MANVVVEAFVGEAGNPSIGKLDDGSYTIVLDGKVSHGEAKLNKAKTAMYRSSYLSGLVGTDKLTLSSFDLSKLMSKAVNEKLIIPTVLAFTVSRKDAKDTYGEVKFAEFISPADGGIEILIKSPKVS